MARLPRLVIPNQLHHVIAQGHNDQPIVRDDADYQAFLTWLREAARQSRVAIHAYVVLPSRLQLLATPADDTGLSKMMQSLGRLYVPYFNARYARTGGLWEGRFRATVLDSVGYFVPCACMIEYQQVSKSPVDSAVSEKIWLATRKAWALGSEEFCRRLAKLTARRLAPVSRGRPRKAAAEQGAAVKQAVKARSTRSSLRPRAKTPEKAG